LFESFDIMIRLLRPAVVAICLGLGCFASLSTAEAQWGCGYGMWGSYGYNVYSQEDIPYFAKHPPVYYSRPVARSYGWSPFAYPGYVTTPAAPVVHHSNPEMVLNPFFKKDESGSQGNTAPNVEPAIQTAKRIQVIHPTRDSGDARLAKHGS
jgi:hypothetical protein